MGVELPPWKVYRHGEYIAALKYPEDAAAMVPAGGHIKWSHRGPILWAEGSEAFSAFKEPVRCADTMTARLTEHKIERGLL